MTLRVTTKDENSRGGSRRINNLVAIFEGEKQWFKLGFHCELWAAG